MILQKLSINEAMPRRVNGQAWKKQKELSGRNASSIAPVATRPPASGSTL